MDAVLFLLELREKEKGTLHKLLAAEVKASAKSRGLVFKSNMKKQPLMDLMVWNACEVLSCFVMSKRDIDIQYSVNMRWGQIFSMNQLTVMSVSKTGFYILLIAVQISIFIWRVTIRSVDSMFKWVTLL